MVWSGSLWSGWLRVSAACFKVGLSVVGVHDQVVVVSICYTLHCQTLHYQIFCVRLVVCLNCTVFKHGAMLCNAVYALQGGRQ